MKLQSGTSLNLLQPFNRADARAAGLTLQELLSPRFQRILYDVYVSAAVQISLPLLATAALAISAPGAYASHVTAAALWGAIVPHSGSVHLSVPQGRPRSKRSGITAHRSGPSPEVLRQDGVPLSAPVACLLEMAADGLGLIDLVVAADSLLRLKRVTRDQLVAAATSYRGRGARVARRMAFLARSGVDSAMETRLRLLIVLAGLGDPVVNWVLRDGDGEWVMRFDLCFPALKLIVEYDGRQHAESAKQWQRDIRRREQLDRLGWRIVIVDADGIFVRPGETIERIRDAMEELSGRRPRLTRGSEWRREFPGRPD